MRCGATRPAGAVTAPLRIVLWPVDTAAEPGQMTQQGDMTSQQPGASQPGDGAGVLPAEPAGQPATPYWPSPYLAEGQSAPEAYPAPARPGQPRYGDPAGQFRPGPQRRARPSELRPAGPVRRSRAVRSGRAGWPTRPRRARRRQRCRRARRHGARQRLGATAGDDHGLAADPGGQLPAAARADGTAGGPAAGGDDDRAGARAHGRAERVRETSSRARPRSARWSATS